MTCILGIDHPLVAVKDLGAALETYRSLGFFIAPPGQHPWGTSTALALFHHQILELVSIGDASLLDGYETGDFRFGRHGEAYLNASEGVALSALFSDDAERTETQLAERGLAATGTVNFGRDVVRSDGQPDRTKTTLKIYRNDEMPRLSMFACQQHRRDLLEFPDRMDHPNGARGFAAATIVTAPNDKDAVLNWLTTLHIAQVRTDTNGFDIVPTTNGVWRVVDAAQFHGLFEVPIDDDFLAHGPRVAALDVRVSDVDRVRQSASASQCQIIEQTAGLLVNDMSRLGGIAMRFVECLSGEE